MSAKQSFHEVYKLTRLNRGNIHFRGQFFSFADKRGDIYIDDTGALVIGRLGRMQAYSAAVLSSDLIGAAKRSLDYRRHTLDRCSEVGRVPLP